MKSGKYKLTLYKFEEEGGRLISTQSIDFSIRPLKVLRFYAPKVSGVKGFTKIEFDEKDLFKLLVSIFEPYFVNLSGFASDDADRSQLQRIQKRMIELGMNKATKSWIKQELKVPKQLWCMEPELLSGKDMLELARRTFFASL